MAKVTTLQETKDITEFNLEQFDGSLMTHELQLDNENGDMSKHKSIALKADESDDSENDDEESALMVRKFKWIFRKFKLLLLFFMWLAKHLLLVLSLDS